MICITAPLEFVLLWRQRVPFLHSRPFSLYFVAIVCLFLFRFEAVHNEKVVRFACVKLEICIYCCCFCFFCSCLQAMMTTSEPLLLRTGVKKEEIDVQHHHHHHHQQQQQLQHHSHFCSMDDECSPADSSLYSPTTTALQLEVTRFSLYSRLLSSTEQQQ